MSFDLKITDGDVVIKDGDLRKVENNDKLIQDILKLVLTPLGVNTQYPWYGSPVSKSTIGNALDVTFAFPIATSQLRSSLETLQRLQKQQANFQMVTATEQLAAIQDLKVEQNQVDPRFITIKIRVLTKALSSVETEFSIRGL